MFLSTTSIVFASSAVGWNSSRSSGDGQRAIGVDLDCNVWASDTPNRRIVKYSPSGKQLAAAAVPDLIANDVAVGPTGDLYVIHQNTGIVHFAEDRSKPAAAAVAGVAVARKGAGYVARVKYTLAGVACPAQVAATASLAGKGIVGKATVKVGAGKTTVIEIPLARGALKTVAGTSAARRRSRSLSRRTGARRRRRAALR